MEMYLLTRFEQAKAYLKRVSLNQKGEGMVGWILATLLVITIVVTLHGLIKGWLPGLWSKIQGRIDTIV